MQFFKCVSRRGIILVWDYSEILCDASLATQMTQIRVLQIEIWIDLGPNTWNTLIPHVAACCSWGTYAWLLKNSFQACKEASRASQKTLTGGPNSVKANVVLHIQYIIQTEITPRTLPEYVIPHEANLSQVVRCLELRARSHTWNFALPAWRKGIFCGKPPTQKPF